MEVLHYCWNNVWLLKFSDPATMDLYPRLMGNSSCHALKLKQHLYDQMLAQSDFCDVTLRFSGVVSTLCMLMLFVNFCWIQYFARTQSSQQNITLQKFKLFNWHVALYDTKPQKRKNAGVRVCVWSKTMLYRDLIAV